jgi:hypothetical protein
MILWDVNVLVYAFRFDSPHYERSRADIMAAFDSGETYIFDPGIAASFLRLVTNPRVFSQPSGIGEAWDFVDSLAERTTALHAEIDSMTFGIFKSLSLAFGSTGNAIPDALIAAIAIRHDATLHTMDAGFAKYRGLKIKTP